MHSAQLCVCFVFKLKMVWMYRLLFWFVKCLVVCRQWMIDCKCDCIFINKCVLKVWMWHILLQYWILYYIYQQQFVRFQHYLQWFWHLFVRCNIHAHKCNLQQEYNVCNYNIQIYFIIYYQLRCISYRSAYFVFGCIWHCSTSA